MTGRTPRVRLEAQHCLAAAPRDEGEVLERVDVFDQEEDVCEEVGLHTAGHGRLTEFSIRGVL